VQLVADLHGADSYQRWRRRQLERIPRRFVPDFDLADEYAVLRWAVRPGAPVDFPRWPCLSVVRDCGHPAGSDAPSRTEKAEP
jgi:hypothetical protein